MQKYGSFANEFAKKEFICLVCSIKNPSFSWTDKHGEGVCMTCGTPYQLMSGGKVEEDFPRINIDEHYVDVIKRYWNETNQFMGLGSYLGFRGYPECKKGQENLDCLCSTEMIL